MFHGDTLELAGPPSKRSKFLTALVDTIFDGLVERYTMVKFDRQNFSFPNLRMKGTPENTVIRRSVSKSHGPMIEEVSETLTPEYQIIHRGVVEVGDYTNDGSSKSSVPKELLIRVQLPLIVSIISAD